MFFCHCKKPAKFYAKEVEVTSPDKFGPRTYGLPMKLNNATYAFCSRHANQGLSDVLARCDQVIVTRVDLDGG